MMHSHDLTSCVCPHNGLLGLQDTPYNYPNNSIYQQNHNNKVHCFRSKQVKSVNNKYTT